MALCTFSSVVLVVAEDMLLKDRPYRDGQKITVCVEMTNTTDVNKTSNVSTNP